MSNPLEPEVTGDLSAMGISDRNDPGAEIYGDVQEEAQATAAEEAPAPVEEQAVEVQAQEEPEQAEDDQPKSILAQLAEQEQVEEKPDEQSELTRLQQKNLRLEAALQERRAIAEEAIRQKADAVAPPQPEQPESYLKHPVIQQTLRHVRDENPEQYEQTLIELAKAEFQKEVEAKEKALVERLEQYEKKATEAEQQARVKQGIETALNGIRAEGGLYAELVEEFQEQGMNSHIGRKMQQSPEMFYSPAGTEDAVRSLESRLRSQIERAKHPEQSQPVRGAVVSAGTGRASTRGVDMHEKPVETTPEDQYADMVFGTSRNKKLEFLG